MLDNRYPNLVRIEDAPIDPVRRGKMRRFAQNVGNRTGVKMCFNRNTESLFCYYGDAPDHGPCEVPGSMRFDTVDEDDVVRMLQYGHRSRVEKDRQLEAEEASHKNELKTEQERFIESNRKGVEEKAAFLSRKRRGVSKVSITT